MYCLCTCLYCMLICLLDQASLELTNLFLLSHNLIVYCLIVSCTYLTILCCVHICTVISIAGYCCSYSLCRFSVLWSVIALIAGHLNEILITCILPIKVEIYYLIIITIIMKSTKVQSVIWLKCNIWIENIFAVNTMVYTKTELY